MNFRSNFVPPILVAGSASCCQLLPAAASCCQLLPAAAFAWPLSIEFLDLLAQQLRPVRAQYYKTLMGKSKFVDHQDFLQKSKQRKLSYRNEKWEIIKLPTANRLRDTTEWNTKVKLLQRRAIRRYFDLELLWFVDILIWRHFALATFWLGNFLIWQHFDLATFGLATFWFGNRLRSSHKPNINSP